MKITFYQREDAPDFTAMHAAEAWCRDKGVSYGPSCGTLPRGLLCGDFEIAKWRNLTPQERRECHGTMKGPLRKGPIVVTIADVHWAFHTGSVSGDAASKLS